MAKRPTRNARMKGQDVEEQGRVSRFKCLCYQKIIIKSIMQNIIGNAAAGRADSEMNANKCIPIILFNFTG